MVHAKLGGPPAASVVSYLESLGDADLPLKDEPIDDRGSRAARRPLQLRRPRARQLHRRHEPKQVAIASRRCHGPESAGTWATSSSIRSGAPAVRIRFEREGAKVVALTVLDPDVVVRARKVA